MDADPSLPRSSHPGIRPKRSYALAICKTRSALFVFCVPILTGLTVALLLLSGSTSSVSSKGQYFVEKRISFLATQQQQPTQAGETNSQHNWSSPHPVATSIVVMLFLGMLFWLFSKSRQETRRKRTAGQMRSKRHLV